MLSSSHGLLVRVIIPGNRKKMTRVKEKKKRLRENTNLWSTIASQRLVLSYFVRETAKDNNSKAKESFKKGVIIIGEESTLQRIVIESNSR